MKKGVKKVIRLEKMRADEFTIFNEVNIALLSKLFVRKLPEDEARKKAEKKQKELLPEGADTPGQFLLSIKDENKFTGGIWFTRLSRENTELAFIFFIWISPEARARGTGSEAMRLVEDEIKKKGLGIIRLHVLKDNIAALRVYNKLGYSLFTDYKNYDENDPGIIMEKII